jgi:hypothetical protein
MNERIRELGRQATIWCVSQPNQDDFDAMWEEKFAELIIQDALGDLKERIALRYGGSERDRDIGYGMEIVYYDIVDKFGVNENVEFDNKSVD